MAGGSPQDGGTATGSQGGIGSDAVAGGSLQDGGTAPGSQGGIGSDAVAGGSPQDGGTATGSQGGIGSDAVAGGSLQDGGTATGSQGGIGSDAVAGGSLQDGGTATGSQGGIGSDAVAGGTTQDGGSAAGQAGIGSDAVAGGTSGNGGEAAPNGGGGYNAIGSAYSGSDRNGNDGQTGDSQDGSNSQGGSESPGGGIGAQPVILDLTGGGIKITPLTSSNTFVKLDDGYSHRTAWAGVGNAVLFYDPNNANAITESDQYDFTEWDPTASSDMQALRDVADTNHDGLLDVGDAAFASFKLMVTNADGTTTVETLAQAGVASINLIPSNANVQQIDGSVETGLTTYAKSGGGTGAAGDVTLASDAQGYVLKQTVTHGLDGSTTIDNKAYNAAGDLASDTASTTSANGLSRTLTFDSNGDGTVDGKQTDVTVTNPDGSKTETVSDYGSGGVALIDSFVTKTTADGKTVTITRDFTGGGIVQQTETRQINADGSSTDTVKNVNADGSLASQTLTSISADGLSKTTQHDEDGSGNYEVTTTDATVVKPDGTRVETVTDNSFNNTKLDQSISTITPDGQTKTVQEDHSGSGTFDLTIQSVTGNGSTTTTTSEKNANGSSRGNLTTIFSLDGLTKTNQADLTGDGTPDRTTTDTTVNNTDGSRTETVQVSSTNGTTLSKTVTLQGADGISRTTTIDANGDNKTDATDAVAVVFGGYQETAFIRNPDGSSAGETITTTSNNGLSKTVQFDHAGSNTIDETITDTIVPTSGGGSTETVNATNTDHTSRGETITTISADDLTTTTQSDLDGNSTIDRTVTDATVINSDNSRTETVSTTDGNVLLSKVKTATSADRQNVTITTDAAGDGPATQSETISTASNGLVTDTLTNLNADGSTINRTVTTTTANGLSITTQVDQAGTGNSFNLITTDVTTLNPDGSKSEVVTDKNSDQTVTIDKTTIKTSGNGLSITTSHDYDGDGTVNLTTTDVTGFGTDGSATETIRDMNNNRSLRDSTVISTSGNGLSRTVTHDFDGDGVVDLTTSDVTTLGADGSTSETVTDTNAHGLRDSSVTTTSADRNSVTVQRQFYGSVTFSQSESTVAAPSGNGDVIDTLSTSNSAGQMIFNRIITSSANGLSQTVATDVNGDGTTDVTSKDTVVFRTDSSRYETGTTMSGTTLIQKTIATTSANGLVKNGQADFNGDGTIDLNTTDATAYNTDGSVTETIQSLNADQTQRSETVTNTSADRKTVSVNRIYGTDGNQVDVTAVQNNGTILEYIKDYDNTGTQIAGKNISTTANGLSRTTNFTTAAGAALDTATDTTTLNTNGGRTETYTDQDVISTTGPTVTASTALTVTTTANGLSKTSNLTLNGQARYAATDNTAMNTDGSNLETIVDTVGSTAVDKLAISLSANALTKIVSLSAAGANGPVTLNDTIVYGTDGSRTETLVNTNSVTGNQAQKDVITTSADGRTTGLRSARNGDTAYDHFETTITNPDGSVYDNNSAVDPTTGLSYQQGRVQRIGTDGGTVVTVTNMDGSGNIQSRTVSTTSSNLLSHITSTQTFGTGTADITRTDVTVLNNDGSQTDTEKTYGAGGAGNANGGLISQQVTTTSADGLTVTTQADNDGNGVFEAKDVEVTATDGSKTETVTDYNDTNGQILTLTAADGSTATSTVETTSANGLITTDIEGGLTSTTVNFAGASGSYEWAEASAGTQIAAAFHLIDAAKVDTWTYTPTSGSTVTVALDLASEARAVGQAQAIAQAVLGRSYGTIEVQALGKYISGGVLNQLQFTNDLLGSAEFNQKYGALNNSFIVRAYENVFGQLEAGTDVSTFMNQLAAGTTTIAAVIDAIAQQGQDEAGGNGLLQLLSNAPQEAGAVSLQPTSFSGLVGSGTAYESFVVSFSLPPGQNPSPAQVNAFVNLVYGSSNGVTTHQGSNLVTASANGTTDEIYYGTNTSINVVTNSLTKLVDVSNTNSQSSYNTLRAGSGSGVVLTGSTYDVLMGGTGSSSLLALGANEQVTTGAGMNAVYVQGTAVSVNASAGKASIAIAQGASNAIVTGATSKTTIDVSGTGASLTGTSASITLEAGATAAVAGSSNTIAAAANSVLMIVGTSQIINENNATLSLATGASATLAGNGNIISQQSNSTLTATGESNFDTIVGTGVTASLGYALVDFAVLSSATINGNTNSLVLGSNDTVIATGNGTFATIQGTADSLTVTSGLIGLTSGSSATVIGNGNTITAGGTGDTLTAQGTGLILSLNSSNLMLASSSTAVLSGSGDAIGVYNSSTLNAGAATAAQVFVQGTGSSISVTSGTVTLNDGSSATVTGNNNQLIFKGAETLTASGTGDKLIFQPSPLTSTFTGYDASDTFQVSTSTFADFAHFQAASSQQGANTVVHTDASHTITLNNVTLSSLNASHFSFV